jgi:gluconolactonase
MIARRLLLLAVLASLAAFTQAEETKTLGTIERLDPAFDKLIGKDAVLEVLVTGHDWVEGPVWVSTKEGGKLLYSDIPKNSIYQWQPGKGATVFLRPSGYEGSRTDFVEPGSNGLILDPMGRLILC